MWELGAEVIAIGVEPDGFNINKDCGSTAPEALRRKVREMRADLGIALDGDADRVVMADEHGELIDGDQILALIAESWHEGRPAGEGRHRRHRDVQSRPGAVPDALGHRAGARTRSATAMCSSSMREHGYNVGGEQSGHIILSDFATTGDGFWRRCRCWRW